MAPPWPGGELSFLPCSSLLGTRCPSGGGWVLRRALGRGAVGTGWSSGCSGTCHLLWGLRPPQPDARSMCHLGPSALGLWCAQRCFPPAQVTPARCPPRWSWRRPSACPVSTGTKGSPFTVSGTGGVGWDELSGHPRSRHLGRTTRGRLPCGGSRCESSGAREAEGVACNAMWVSFPLTFFLTQIETALAVETVRGLRPGHGAWVLVSPGASVSRASALLQLRGSGHRAGVGGAGDRGTGDHATPLPGVERALPVAHPASQLPSARWAQS